MISKNTYTEYKASGQEWLGEIPKHWHVQRTKALFQLITQPAPKNNNEELLSVYTDIGVRPRKELEARGNKASTTDNYWLVKKSDIIVNKLLAWMGAIGISEFEGVTSPAYDVLRKRKDLNPYYYNYLFRSSIIRNELRRYSKGIMDMRLRLYFDQFGQIFLPFPSIKEQTAIADFLDRRTEEIKNFISLKEKAIALLKEQRATIIKFAITKGINSGNGMVDSQIEWLGEVPEHWEVKPLKTFVDFINRGTPPNYTSQSQIKVVNQATFSKGYWDESEVRFHAKKGSGIERGELRRDDILLASTGGGVLGKVGYFSTRDGCYLADSHVTIIRDSKKRIIPKFYFYWFENSFDLINGILAQGSTNQIELQGSRLRSLYLPYPNIEEQKKIVNYIESKNSQIESAIAQAEKEIALIKEYKQSIINAAVTGKIDVRNKMHVNG